MYTVGSPAGCVVEHMLSWPNMVHILLGKFWRAFRDMAPCRVYIRNLLFSVTYQVLAAFLRDAGLAFERIDIKRTGMRFGQARYCYAFVSVATEEVQRRLISRLHGQTCELCPTNAYLLRPRSSNECMDAAVAASGGQA